MLEQKYVLWQIVTQDFLPQLQSPSLQETPRNDHSSREVGINGKHRNLYQQDPRKIICLHPNMRDS